MFCSSGVSWFVCESETEVAITVTTAAYHDVEVQDGLQRPFAGPSAARGSAVVLIHWVTYKDV